MDDKVLRFSLLTKEDQASYTWLVNAPRWEERVDEYKKEKEQDRIGNNPLVNSLAFLSGSYSFDFRPLFTIMRGRFFHYDQKRAKRIQNFLKDMQMKYGCDSIDPTHFPGSARWQ